MARSRRLWQRPAREAKSPKAATVAEGWDRYARRRLGEKRLGDEWNDPTEIGIDVENPEEILPYLDGVVFSPFLGTNDVLLEIGPGGGRFTELLLPRCQRLIAVDTSPAMLELLRERFGADAPIECRLGDGLGLDAVIQHSNTFSELGWEVFENEVPKQVNRHKLPFTFTLNSPEVMRELVRRAGLEPVEAVTDVVRRDCITLLRKPEAA